ncbi:MAG TPA: hypothetical protein VLF89_08085 [Candidatus Saccharimonadales bacterium]|nr:hypothetical protein [Candidatus Saccharimonadales bacterium]
MKVYFTASVAAKDQYLDQYLNIINYLKSLGHTITSSHITEMTESLINELPREEVLDFHSKVEKWIKECDFIIADTAFPSVSVGYEISLALRMGKPVLVFYENGGPPSLLRYHKDENLITERYTSATYKEVIKSFIHSISGKSDLKFIFLITPKIANFLDDIVHKEKTPKSVYIRKLIEEDMKNHDF